MQQKREPDGPAGRRKRRTPAVARRAILDAAGRRLMEDGPDGLRLQPIAADLGISHSSILHHFGSREGLLDALARDAFGALERDLQRSMQPPSNGEPAADVFEVVAEALGKKGYAKLLAWQILSGRRATAPGETSRVVGPDGGAGLLDGLARRLHNLRIEHARTQGQTPPELDETRSIVVLVACSIFGEALAGSVIVASAGLGGEEADRKRFRDWTARMTESLAFPDSAPDSRGRSRGRSGGDSGGEDASRSHRVGWCRP